MLINSASLDALRVGFSAAFNGGLGMADEDWKQLATIVPSSTKENKYGWIGKIPNMREWIGPRVIHGLAEHDYSIANKSVELTIGVDRDDIEDDNIGVYKPMFEEMGQSVAADPSLLLYGLLKDGFATECYDGQYFFDTDHPVLDADGVTTGSVSNDGGGSGAPWFLLCTNRALKPLIFQERKKPQFVAKDDPKDERNFFNKEFVYGVDARRNAGYGFWQMAYGSKQTLDAAAYQVARAAIGGFKGDHGRPLGLKPNLLVVGTANEGAAREILTAERDAAGATNIWKGTAELLVSPWLD